MNFPKTLIIGGVPWKIIFDKKVSGGEFRWKDHTIRIHAKYTDERKWQVLIHEIVEAILVNNSMRWSPAFDNVQAGDYLFSFNHKEFEIFTDELSGILKQLKEAKCP